MRQIVAIVFLSFAAAFTANADNDDIQQGIFDAYLKLASGGDAVAQYVVAQRYETGKGTTKNLEKAFYWYEMAAKQNYPLAVVKLDGYKKEQKTAEPALTEKVQNTAPTPKETQLKKEPEKKPSVPPKETVARPKLKSESVAVAPVHAPPVQVSKPKPAEPVARNETVVRPKVKPDSAPVAPVQAPPVQVSKPKPAEPVARNEEVKQEVKLPAPEVVAKAPVVVEPPLPNINVIQALLTGKWKRNQQDADFLPSSNAACLQSGNAEVVCFSQELTRNLDNNGLTYNVKSVISGINNKEAKFNLRYTYNVVHIAGKPHEQTNGMRNEVNDMAVKTGWQEPGVGMECRMRDERSLTCTRADRKMAYQFVRD
jgi:TPR repeat protein